MSVKVIPVTDAYRDNRERVFVGQAPHASARKGGRKKTHTELSILRGAAFEMEEYKTQMIGPVVWFVGDVISPEEAGRGF